MKSELKIIHITKLVQILQNGNIEWESQQIPSCPNYSRHYTSNALHINPRVDLLKKIFEFPENQALTVTFIFSKYLKSVYSFIFNLGRYLKNWDLKVSVCVCVHIHVYV